MSNVSVANLYAVASRFDIKEQYQHYRIDGTGKYEEGIDELGKFETGKYGYLTILEKVDSIGICC